MTYLAPRGATITIKCARCSARTVARPDDTVVDLLHDDLCPAMDAYELNGVDAVIVHWPTPTTAS